MGYKGNMGSLRFQNRILALLALSLVSIDLVIKSLIPEENILLNPGIILGHFSDSNPYLRLIGIGLLFTYIVFLAHLFIFHVLDRKELFKLRMGLVIFFSGVSGNAFDRIFLGHVRDYLYWAFEQKLYFNFADIYQWIGFLLTVYFLFSLRQVIWDERGERKMIVVDKEYQRKVGLILVYAVVFSSLTIGVLGLGFVHVHVGDSALKNSIIADYSILWFFLTLIMGTIVYILGLFFSHRTAGPLYAFQRFVLEMSKDRPAKEFTIRDKDHHQFLVDLAKKINKEVQK